MISASQIWNGVKTVVRNLPTVRKEIVAAATAGISLVGIFEVTFPQVSIAHLTFFAGCTAALTGVTTFLSNNKIVTGLQDFSDQPMWKTRLRTLVRGGNALP